MRKKILQLVWILPLAFLSMMTSCNDEAALETPDSVENFTALTVRGLDSMGNCGRDGAYELVFPITIEFADGQTATVNSYEELIDAVRTWKYENPDVQGRPTFIFPIELIAPDGTVVTVNSADELADLRMGPFPPRPRKGWKDRKGHRGHCFKIVFPMTVNFPDGTFQDANGPREMQQLIRAWKHANPDSPDRPQLDFPIEVELEDGSVITVDSQDELQALKEDCRE